MTLIKTWGLILLLPLVPVVLLYMLFEKQNYFELHDTAKGLVAVGPIAAYVAIVGLATSIYSKISPSFAGLDPQLDELCGDWKFVSTSTDGLSRVGDCFINKKGQQLVVTGTFKEGDKTVGGWRGELTGLRDNNFLMVYSLQEFGHDNLYGLVQVPFTAATAQEMSGTWSVVGRSGLEGTITYTRKPK
jgi:hypothetical protein